MDLSDPLNLTEVQAFHQRSLDFTDPRSTPRLNWKNVSQTFKYIPVRDTQFGNFGTGLDRQFWFIVEDHYTGQWYLYDWFRVWDDMPSGRWLRFPNSFTKLYPEAEREVIRLRQGVERYFKQPWEGHEITKESPLPDCLFKVTPTGPHLLMTPEQREAQWRDDVREMLANVGLIAAAHRVARDHSAHIRRVHPGHSIVNDGVVRPAPPPPLHQPFTLMPNGAQLFNRPEPRLPPSWRGNDQPPPSHQHSLSHEQRQTLSGFRRQIHAQLLADGRI